MEQLLNIDRRIVYLTIFLGVCLPFLVSFVELPVTITTDVQRIHDTIEGLD